VVVLFAAVAAFAVGTGLGIVYQRGSAQRQAVAGAKPLSEEVEAANKSMVSLSDALRAAVEQLQQDEYPDELAEMLKKTEVPFSTANFQGKSVGGLPPEVVGMLLRYTSGVEELNEQKNKLRNLLGAAKPQVERFIKEKKEPVVSFSVLLDQKGDNWTALLVPNKDPFPVKETKETKWPVEYDIMKPGEKRATPEKVKRIINKLEKDIAVPVQEASVAPFKDIRLVLQLRTVLEDVKVLIDGNDSQNPALQTDGLLKEGDRIIDALRKVAQAG
jgi:hypothetical protein